MSAKGFETHKNGNGEGATVLDPKAGDFALGSVESRAAARAMLESRFRLTQYERDCLALYNGEVYLTAQMWPDYQDLERTEAYKRGQEIHYRFFGPPIPAHLDERLKRDTTASLCFLVIHGREPKPGDILRYEELVEIWAGERAKGIKRFGEAWARQIPNLPFPLKFEEGKFYYRSANSKPPGQWVEDDEHDPHSEWAGIQREAFGLGPAWSEASDFDDRIAIRAVVFVEGEESGRYRIQPLDAVDTPQR